MVRRPGSRKIHDVGAREAWDKIVLALAFATGVGGGIALKLQGVHPFVAAAYSASVLISYALVAYLSTSLRLEPEVIGDNSYYLGFLFTLTSLSVTLYFVVDSRVEDRSVLIPEVISGFGVALVSTIVGVFIRVLMMQFRLDIVSREREARVEIDAAARQLRVEMAQSLQQIKLFTVESLQHSAEREAEFKRATDNLIAGTQKALAETVRYLHHETAQVFREQSAASIEVIRKSITETSEAALGQIRLSLDDIGKTADAFRATHAATRNATEQANASLIQQAGAMADLIGQLSRRIRSLSDEVETSGAMLAQSFSTAAGRFASAMSETAQKLDTSLHELEKSNRETAQRSQAAMGELTARLILSADRLVTATDMARDATRATPVELGGLPERGGG